MKFLMFLLNTQQYPKVKSLYFIILIYMDQEDSLHHLTQLGLVVSFFFLSRKVAGFSQSKFSQSSHV